MDALPAADKQRMIAEYQRRYRAKGKASADAWAREAGNRFRRQLIAEGVCPPLADTSKTTARGNERGSDRPLVNRHGKPCKKTGVENRVVPGFGGAPMTMALVPVCKD